MSGPQMLTESQSVRSEDESDVPVSLYDSQVRAVIQDVMLMLEYVHQRGVELPVALGEKVGRLLYELKCGAAEDARAPEVETRVPGTRVARRSSDFSSLKGGEE